MPTKPKICFHSIFVVANNSIVGERKFDPNTLYWRLVNTNWVTKLVAFSLYLVGKYTKKKKKERMK
jgi:hypothetical protein